MKCAVLLVLLVACSFDPGGYTDPVGPGDVDGGLVGPTEPDAIAPSIDAGTTPPTPDATPPADAGCPGEQAFCRESGDLVCFDLQTSDRNCGECGNRCGGDESCITGECIEGD